MIFFIATLIVDTSSCVVQMEYQRQVDSLRVQDAIEGDFSVSQAELSSRQAMLENASDIKVRRLGNFPLSRLITLSTVY